MKYIKIYESEQNYLKKLDKYFLITSTAWKNNHQYLIAENLGNQLKKIYDILSDGTILIHRKPFYYSLPEDKFYEKLVYQTNNLDDILENYKTYINSTKYNL